MDDYFYKDWMYTGKDEYRHELSYPVAPLQTIEPSPQPSPPLPLSPGVLCTHANRFRNGNCFQEIVSTTQGTVKAYSLSTIPVTALYAARGVLIARNEWTLHFFDPVTLQLLHEEPWPVEASGLFVDSQKCIGINRGMYEFAPNGSCRRITRIPYALELSFLEAAAYGPDLVISGFQPEPMLPMGQYPFGFLHAIPPDGISEPREQGQPHKIAKSTMVSYFNRYHSLPVYLDDAIVQPMRDRISFFNKDLSVSKVLTGDFNHCLVSAGALDTLYALAGKGDSYELYIVNIKGQIINKSTLSPGVGIPVCPPIVGTDGIVFCFGKRGVETFDITGEGLWNQVLSMESDNQAHALCYGQTLSVCVGNRIVFFSGAGEKTFSHVEVERSFTTPLVNVSDNRYVAGTNSGLIAFEF